MMAAHAQSGVRACPPRRGHAAGFTLVEVLVSLVIVGIVTAIALPAYSQYTLKAQRNNAKAILVETAQFMERFHTANGTYAGAAVPAASAPKGSTGTNQRYLIEFTGTQNATVYTVQAVPKNAQTKDSCGTLSLTNVGVQSPSTAGCW